MGELLLGCCGWDYEEWIGPFYTRSKGSKLAAYSRVFSTAEINSTFYRPPTSGMVLGWTRYTPEDFVFTAKVPQTVTHDKLLKVEKRAQEDLLDFCQLMKPLLDAGKLGPLLLQLPPRLKFYEERTRSFFEELPSGFEFAIEFRNESWMTPEAFDLLRDYKVAYTIVDEPLLPPEVHVTSETAYIRWHGHGSDPWYNYRYSRGELEAWVPRLNEMKTRARRVYGYFNNHFHGYAPENCLEVLEMLGAITPEQARTLRQIRDFRRGVLRAQHGRVQTTTLDQFGLERATEVEDMLLELTTSPRFQRARALAGEGIHLKVHGSVVEARLGQYAIQLDSVARKLKHDCEDWKKNAETGPLCKHLCAVFLSLKRGASSSILQDLADNRDRWEFDTGPTG